MRENEEAFITVLSSTEFLEGLQVTYYSLRKYSGKDVIVLVNESIPKEICNELSDLGMIVMLTQDICLDKIHLSTRMIEDRWYKTLFKLRVFSITRYQKLVYLDSDLLICGNIDDLFNKNNFSAVPDKDFSPQYGRSGLNAGVICFEPADQMEQELIDFIPKVAEQNEVFGDQDVMNAYLDDWDKEYDKHLDVKYNACFYELEQYKNLTPCIVHFILADKPWMWSKKRIIAKKLKYIICRYWKMLKYLDLYLSILKEVR